MFVAGKRVATLTKEETFAFNAVKNKLRLAAYSVEENGATCTLNVKHNGRKNKFKIGADGRVTLNIDLTMTAGLLDYSKALGLEEGKDAGDVPSGVFTAAKKRLERQIRTVFEKCRTSGCDLFEIISALQKKDKKRFESLKNTALDTALLDVCVTFRNRNNSI